tara:strand:- start:20418 stop:21200 length:783 start_codon:yes stop_codon:yes gene_type:complete
MFITTKAEFKWDGEKYVEVHTEGYEYEGELALADYGDDDDYTSHGAGGQGANPGSGGSPSLQDLTTKDVGQIMLDMGFTQEEVDKYAGYVPEFDPWKAGYAQEAYDVNATRMDLEQSGIETSRQLTQDLFGLSQQGLSQQMFGAAQAGEQSLYGAYQQQSAVAGAGLGKRSNITDRMRGQSISQYESQMDTLGLQGLEQEAKFEAQMEDFTNQLSMLETDRSMADIDLRRDVESEQRQYEDDFWEFMTFLKTNFDVGFDD